MDLILNILEAAAGAVLIIFGLVNISGRLVPGSTTSKKYTEESIQKWLRPEGISDVIFGIGVLILGITDICSMPEWCRWAGYGIAAIGAIGAGYAMKTILVKK